ncbi:MAG TPA: peptide-methionine (S)-S-oxide reductase MsrA [Flavobacteriales bacterium]|nr:peptide-methionine (S)-S-oxide reductase MsrA [Flavobacteriales bacterium]
MYRFTWQIFVFISVLFFECHGSASTNNQNALINKPTQEINMDGMETVTLGGGCFWCIEAVLLNLEGVQTVISGYAGGTTKNPTYREVCTGTTGHAEVVQVVYDPKKVSFEEILEVFFTVHDPTTLNRQGHDVGTQYRSVIFYNSPEQKKRAETLVAELDKSGAYSSPIVTQVAELTNFYKAEDYHQNYYNNNPEQGYCQYVIQPKLEKFRKVFPGKLKK